MAKVNDLQCAGDALFQSDVKVNGKLNNEVLDVDDNCIIIQFCKKLDCTTVGNKVTLFTIPTGYYGVCFEEQNGYKGPLKITGTADTSTQPTQASIDIKSTYGGSAQTYTTYVPINGSSTINFNSQGYLIEEGAVEVEVSSAGTNQATAYIAGVYMLIPTA